MILFTPNSVIRAADHNSNNLELKTKADYLTTPDTAWHYVGQAGQPAFENGWSNYDTAWQPIRYRKDALGYVTIEGLAKGGTNNTIFTLPVGFRVAQTPVGGQGLIFAVAATDAFGRIDVKLDGKVTKGSAGANGYVSLSGIRFKAEA